jgi:hypothetical protein
MRGLTWFDAPARVAESADAEVLNTSSREGVRVQVPSRAQLLPPNRRYSNLCSRRTRIASQGSGDRLYNVDMNEPVAKAQDLELDSAVFWLDTDLENLLADVRPYEGPQDYAIDDLTDDEWDRFVAALSE